MKRFFSTLSTIAACSIVTPFAPLAFAQPNNPSSAERFAKPSDELVARESKYWKRIPLEVPADIVLETSGILPLPGQRLLVTTRRGEVYFIDGAFAAEPKLTFSLFASGLHEPLGIIAAPVPRKGYYVAQRAELTRLEDTDGDGRADVFETVAKIPISGSYHEYAFGPVLAPNGHLRVTLNVAFGGATQAPVPWRGWMMEITPDGQMTPIAAGLRSPAGFTVTSGGDWFASDNQGEWVGSGKLTHIERGDFLGHPAGLVWSKQPGSPVSLRPDDITSFGKPMAEVAKKLPGVKSPAVWLPHTVLGISNSGVLEDLSGGKFGPFAGQFFLGDYTLSIILRATTEQVNGVWQGACYPFREGLATGVMNVEFSTQGQLVAGGFTTNAQWPVRGTAPFALQRLDWSGLTPFEVKEINIRPDGFLVNFTLPVDLAVAADPANYAVTTYTHIYQAGYGSPEVDQTEPRVLKAEPSADGLSVRLTLAKLEVGHIHDFDFAKVRGRDGAPLLHTKAYYTVNEIPTK